ncbi:unnamed protein product [Spodoptera exigua]|nr:unnamed protein product [Spodoptera exigua]
MDSSLTFINFLAFIGIFLISHPSWCKGFVAFQVDRADQQFQSSSWKRIRRMAESQSCVDGSSLGTGHQLDDCRRIEQKPEINGSSTIVFEQMEEDFIVNNSNEADGEEDLLKVIPLQRS